LSDGFWSLGNAPKWWFDKRAWAAVAISAVLMLAAYWHFGPQRVLPGQVVFYGTAWCPYTQALREHLVTSGIPFQERNVEDSFTNLVRFSFAAGRGAGMPVVQVGPRIVAKGFYRDEIDAALIAAGYRPANDSSGPDGASQRR